MTYRGIKGALVLQETCSSSTSDGYGNLTDEQLYCFEEALGDLLTRAEKG